MEFDQDRADAKNLVVTVLSVEDGKFTVGTKNGRVERNALDVTKCKALSVGCDVPDSEHSVRELVRLDSVGGGEDFAAVIAARNAA